MNKIKFTHVWDKLNDPEFTTIRSWNKEKEDYYRGCIGQEFPAGKSRIHFPISLSMSFAMLFFRMCRFWILSVFQWRH